MTERDGQEVSRDGFVSRFRPAPFSSLQSQRACDKPNRNMKEVTEATCDVCGHCGHAACSLITCIDCIVGRVAAATAGFIHSRCVAVSLISK